jgi:hypothetical protein
MLNNLIKNLLISSLDGLIENIDPKDIDEEKSYLKGK